ncbi:MAG: alpha/beta hydrolase, partial [Gammaproteobacteria bacterium]
LKPFSSSMEANIFSLDYRLSPENKFPASLEDANLALEWIASTYDLPISSIGLCGDSAGAHLAASLSTYRSINDLELPHSQCLIYPMIDPACSSNSQKDFATGYFLTHNIMRWFWDQLLQSHSAPLPKTLIITAGFDPLCNEGEDYARKIYAAGNDVEQIHYPHLIHGFVNMTALREAKKAAIDLSKTYKSYFKT